MSDEMTFPTVLEGIDLSETDTLNMFIRQLFRNQGDVGMRMPNTPEVVEVLEDLGLPPKSYNRTMDNLDLHNQDLWFPKHHVCTFLLRWMLKLVIGGGCVVGFTNMFAIRNDDPRWVGAALIASLAALGAATALKMRMDRKVIFRTSDIADIHGGFGFTNDIRRRLVHLKTRIPELEVRAQQTFYKRKPVALTVEARSINEGFGQEPKWMCFFEIDRRVDNPSLLAS